MAKRAWNPDKDKKLQSTEERLRKIRASLQRLKRTKIKSERQIRAERLHALGAIVDEEARRDHQFMQRLRDLVKRKAGAHAEAFIGTPYAADDTASEPNSEVSSDLAARRPTLSLSKGAN